MPKDPAAHPRMLRISMKMRQRFRSDLNGILETSWVNFHKATVIKEATTSTSMLSRTRETPESVPYSMSVMLILSVSTSRGMCKRIIKIDTTILA